MPAVNLQLRNLGPIPEADLQLGDLTVLVGPQASGKSIALQMLKLVIDRSWIHSAMAGQGLNWSSDTRGFFDLYMGEGMRSVWRKGTAVRLDDRLQSLRTLTRKGPLQEVVAPLLVPAEEFPQQRVFYIPAQRVMSLRDGQTRAFGEYRAGDPYVLREFSHQVHEIVQGELTRGTDRLFPKGQRFTRPLRDVVSGTVFNYWELGIDATTGQRRFALTSPSLDDGEGEGEGEGMSPPPLQFLAWSAGQREFTPLLLGMYKLMPPGAIQRRGALRWAILEEPESGLHPRAIAGVLAFVLELLRRGYKVAISTHSPLILESVWALQLLRDHRGDANDVLEMLLGTSPRELRAAADTALRADCRVYYFDYDKPVQDITELDPASEHEGIAGWGGLTAFSANISRVVSRVISRFESASSER